MKKEMMFFTLFFVLLMTVPQVAFSEDKAFDTYHLPGKTTELTPGEKTSMNAIHGSFIGYAFFGSIGYERLITNNVGLNVEYSFLPLVIVDITLVPVYASFYLGDSHRFYADVGGLYVKADLNAFDAASGSTFIGTAGIGYNYHSLTGGFYFKAGFLIFFGGDTTVPWPNLKIGYAF
ncbi:MAG: hypothetical protein OEZ36_01890 [Spirochaetota bacterium]|nr:hypothetical protein [Spirochaetota bacterium]